MAPSLLRHLFGRFQARRAAMSPSPAPSAPTPAPPPVPAAPTLLPRAPGPMRVVAISRILDEADIIEAFLRHTAAYADHHVILDNGSRDGTLEIIRALKDEGLNLTVFQNIAVSINERAFNTLMYYHAAAELQADWVLCLDADEFIDDRGVQDGLRVALDHTMREAPHRLCLALPYFDYVRGAQEIADEPIVPVRMPVRRTRANRLRKVFVRAPLDDAVISNGNHGLMLRGTWLPAQGLPGLRLAHYPHRSLYQMAAKSAKGWAKIQAAGPAEITRGTSRHYRPLFEGLRDAPQTHLLDARPAPARDDPRLVADPITYRGGPLRYTADTDERMRAIRGMMGYLDDLTARYGRLIETCPEARAMNDAWNRDVTRLM